MSPQAVQAFWFGYVSQFSIRERGASFPTHSMILPATVPSSGGVTAVRIYEYVCNVLNLHIYQSVAEKGGKWFDGPPLSTE
jgi:hypothetical protein